MASYLWIRGRRAFFQIRPPSDLKPELGSTPFRIRLPAQPHREASRYARHLAGLAERWFSAMRYRGVRRLGLGAALAGDESWTESDFAEARVNVRKGFVNSLLAEVQVLNSGKLSRNSRSPTQTNNSRSQKSRKRFLNELPAAGMFSQKNLSRTTIRSSRTCLAHVTAQIKWTWPR